MNIVEYGLAISGSFLSLLPQQGFLLLGYLLQSFHFGRITRVNVLVVGMSGSLNRLALDATFLFQLGCPKKPFCDSFVTLVL